MNSKNIKDITLLKKNSLKLCLHIILTFALKGSQNRIGQGSENSYVLSKR